MLLDVLWVFSTKRDSQQSDADFAILPVDVSKTASQLFVRFVSSTRQKRLVYESRSIVFHSLFLSHMMAETT